MAGVPGMFSRKSHPEWKWYVYEILRGEKVIYVGKGSSDRAKVSAREKEGYPRAVAYFRHQEDAFRFERQRIRELLDAGAKLQNVSHGVAKTWHSRTDTREMAREVLQWVAYRMDKWMRAGLLNELAQKMHHPVSEVLEIYQIAKSV